MPSKYPICTSDEIASVLEQAGFLKVSQKGSHRKYTKGKHVVILPMHGSKDLKPGTLKGILEQAGMTLEELKGYL